MAPSAQPARDTDLAGLFPGAVLGDLKFISAGAGAKLDANSQSILHGAPGFVNRGGPERLPD
jgi:hypothetical protein